ncbi:MULTISPECIES: hypothetical protein [Rhodanobacteraceae]|uniref:hypothetical protein n=1 Tax=Rhodanobacteraceae TaxID=1775411 RepID=UPI00087E79B7|nr:MULTISPECIES: hypothetical protein [Rhodanobacteraceae]SDG01218.1 hypothetical protein SAMN04515659_1884 [Dyella sp. 333MFSha]SKB30958.1 hypothetical protein SAMN05660880_00495 [Luteibacter sp. 22Crub2.1]
MVDNGMGFARSGGWRVVRFAVLTFVLTIVAHAVAYLAHEYSHSMAAWAFGWMKSPFDIDYGSATPGNILLLGDVSDNVEYAPIIASGAGWQASLIALAGPFVGNGVLFFILDAVSRMDAVRSRRGLQSFVYWLCLMCAGNVWSYVPIRALSTHADIALSAQGFGIPVWLQFPFLMAVSGYIAWHFFRKTFPGVCQNVTHGDPARWLLMAVVTACWFFLFFGAGGMSGSYGTIAWIFSVVSCFLLFPLCAVWLWSTCGLADASSTSASG